MNERILIKFLLLVSFIISGVTKTADAFELFYTNRTPAAIEIAAEFSLGTATAAAKEYVFSYGMLLSELRWPLMPSLIYSGSLDFTFFEQLHIQSCLSFLHPFETQPMTDKDFDNIPYSDILTKFSEHRCMVTRGLRASAKIGIQKEVPLLHIAHQSIRLMIEPMIGIVYSITSWHAWGGYLQYGPLDSNGYHTPWEPLLPKKYITGDAVAYEQELITPTAGIGITVFFPYRIRLYTDVHLSPSIRAWGNDVHFGRDTRFFDVMEGGWGLYCSAKLMIPIASVCSFFAEVKYDSSAIFEGKTYVYKPVDARTPVVISSVPGTALHSFTCTIGIAFMFGKS